MLISDISDRILQRKRNIDRLSALAESIEKVAILLGDALEQGGKVMFCGNGGSAADSQHLATELMGRFMLDRAPLAAMALTTDTSALTAISNDYGYESVFSRQLQGIGRAGDVLVGLSTSGESGNVVRAVRTARDMGIHTVAMTGESGGALAVESGIAINVPATRTDHIQEMHILVGHVLCELVEERFFSS